MSMDGTGKCDKCNAQDDYCTLECPDGTSIDCRDLQLKTVVRNRCPYCKQPNVVAGHNCWHVECDKCTEHHHPCISCEAAGTLKPAPVPLCDKCGKPAPFPCGCEHVQIMESIWNDKATSSGSESLQTPSQACARCGKNPAEGSAMIDNKHYCHSDTDDLTCYMKQLWKDEGFDVGNVSDEIIKSGMHWMKKAEKLERENKKLHEACQISITGEGGDYLDAMRKERDEYRSMSFKHALTIKELRQEREDAHFNAIHNLGVANRLQRENDELRRVVEAAEAWRDSSAKESLLREAALMDAVDEYRNTKEEA